MAQTETICKICNERYEITEIVPGIPTEEEIEGLARDNELYGDITCEYKSYNIGEGESGTDIFFSDEELVEFFENNERDFSDFEAEVAKHGYEVSEYQCGEIHIDVEE